MKNIYSLITTMCMLAVFGCVSLIPSLAAAAPAQPGKKAILVVSFGTTFTDARTLNIDSVESKIRAEFPGYDVRRAFTSRIVLKRIADNEGIKIDTEKQALEKLKAEGYKEVIVQPLHMIGGDEFDKVGKVVAEYANNKAFDRIAIGRPLIYYSGQEEKPDDYATAINALKTQLPKQQKNEAVVFVGHGGNHPANAAYAALQMRLQDAKLKNVFVTTVDGEGYPTFESVIEKMKANKIKKVTLMPLMLVAGDHANNDMAGDEEDSMQTILVKEGFAVEAYLHGLGENKSVQDIFVQHVKDVIDHKYDRNERGADRPAIPVID